MNKFYKTNRIRDMLKPMATLILLVTLLTVTFNTWAQTTRNVPGTYATIQAAITAAVSAIVSVPCVMTIFSSSQ